MKALENPRLLVTGDADAVVDDVHERLFVARADANLDAFRVARVLHGVSEQIQNRLRQRLRVGAQCRVAAVTRDCQGEAELRERVLHCSRRRLHDLVEPRFLQLVRLAPAFDTREVEHAVHQARQTFAFADDGLEVIGSRLRTTRPAQEKRFRVRANRRQRRFQIVRDARNELRTHFRRLRFPMHIAKQQIPRQERCAQHDREHRAVQHSRNRRDGEAIRRPLDVKVNETIAERHSAQRRDWCEAGRPREGSSGKTRP